MITLYFERPNLCGLKINNNFITDFPYKTFLTSSMIVEYVPFTPYYKYFSYLITKNTLNNNQNLTFANINNDNYYVIFNPSYNNNFNFSIIKNIPFNNKNYVLVSLNGYTLFVVNNNAIEKVISLPKYAFYPEISVTNSFIIITATSVDKKYLLVLSSEYKVILSVLADEILPKENELIVKINYNDSLKRTAIYKYNLDETFSLNSLTFEYKKSSSNLLPLLFLEAYISKDIDKINSYLSFETDYNTLQNYLKEITILYCPQNSLSNIFVLSNNENRDVKILKFTISNDKIDTFELL